MKAGSLRPLRAVLWSFIGIRKASESEQDLRQANPIHVLAAGLAAVALFVGGLIALVHWIV